MASSTKFEPQSTFSRVASALALTFLLSGAVATNSGCGKVEYSSGKRVGVVTKFSHKGYVFKTYEGELAMQNFGPRGTGENRAISNTFNFSVLDEKVAEKVNEALENQTPVELKYSQVLLKNPLQQESDYVITDVQPAKGSAPKAEFGPQ